MKKGIIKAREEKVHQKQSDRFEIDGEEMTQGTEEIGLYIRNRRKRLGLTQQQVGDLAGVSDLFVRELEKGKTTVRLGLVIEVAHALGLSLVLTERAVDDER